MGTFFKIIVISLAMVGLCVLMTHYIPSSWSNGWEIPVVKIHVTWAVTALLGFLMIGLSKLKFA